MPNLERKIALLVIVILLTAASVLSAAKNTNNWSDVEVGFIPRYDGMNSIAMWDKNFPDQTEYNTLTYIDHKDNPPVYTPDTQILSSGQFNRYNIIATLGIINVPLNALGAGSIFDLEISSPNIDTSKGNTFALKSANNPMYSRPFKIATVLTVYHCNGAQIFYRDDPDNLIDQTKHFATNANAQWYDLSENTYDDGWNPNRYSNIYVDIILCLPQPEDTNGYKDNIIQVGDYQYYLAESQDYSASIDVTMTLKGWGSKTFTVPFSGYYASGEFTQKEENFCTVSINRLAPASNLSIENDYGSWITIANIDIMESFKDKSEDYVCSNTTKIFASSSKNPYANGGEFTLVRTNVTEGNPLDERNSIGYTIRIEDSTSKKSFDGTDFLYSANNKYEVTNNNYLPLSQKNIPYPNDPDTFTHYHDFSGDMQIMIDPPSTMMEAGAYTSTIYIHIISEEAANTT